MTTLYSFWTHGTALTVESPENVSYIGYFGWGADMDINPGKSSWFHIPLTSPQMLNSDTVRILRTYLFFNAFNCSIRNVHVYDGSMIIHEYNDLSLNGEHRIKKDNSNTFNLLREHTMHSGIGISLFCSAEIGFDSQIPQPRLIIGTAGADYITGFSEGPFHVNKRSEIGIIKS